jgi:hypothetical protein
MSDLLRARRAAKRRRRKRRADRDPVITEEQVERPAPLPPLVSQGGRSQLPPPRRPTADDLLREAAWAARGKPRQLRL